MRTCPVIKEKRDAPGAASAPNVLRRASRASRPYSFFLLLIACLALVSIMAVQAPQSRAASLSWQALPDRERVTISMSGKEGVAGRVARIAPTGVLVPFTQVPPGLLGGDAPPEGARLFKGVMQQGRALVFLTQTPEFGFLVARQTPDELVVDFFPNPLGARWRPGEKAPTTEIPPDDVTEEPRPAGGVMESLAAPPQGGVSGAAVPPPAAGEGRKDVPEKEQPAPVPGTPPAPEPSPAPDAGPGIIRDASNGGSQKPPVVSLSGSPIHAATVTRQAEPPAHRAPIAQGMLRNVGSIPATPPRLAGAPPKPQDSAPLAGPGTDIPSQTTVRAAPLPSLVLPLALPSPMKDDGRHDAESPKEAAALPAAEARRPFPGEAPARPEDAIPAAPAAPGPVPDIPEALPLPPSTEDIPGQIPIRTPMVPPASAPVVSGTPVAPVPPGIGVPMDGATYRGVVNTKGAEGIGVPLAALPADAPAFPEKDAVATLPADTAPLAGKMEQPGHPAKGQPADPTKGKPAASLPADTVAEPVSQEPSPPDVASLMQSMREHFGKKEFHKVLEITEFLLAEDVEGETGGKGEGAAMKAELDAEQREELLHARAAMLFTINKDDLAGHFREIADATNQAISFNPKSRRNAEALLRLGYMNLKLKNIPEAEARFNMLRRLYPEDENVPLSYYYWGEYYFERDELQKAADEFQLVLQKYPNSRYAREAALGLARSFYRLGLYEQAFTVVDYIGRRWERLYIDYPPLLNMIGDVAMRLGKPEDALKQYWLYVNLEPNGEEADIIFTRIGDIYASIREKSAARSLYRESMQRFPGKDGALVAMMRLAEEGVNDDPSIAGMFSVFDGPYSLEPLEVYRGIIKDYPHSALVPLAKIKLAMWHLWKREHLEALDVLSDFLAEFPNHELAPRAKDIALQTFAALATQSMAEGRFGRMHEIWEKYPIVQEQAGVLSPESRIALAVSYWKDGKPNEALETVSPFFLGGKVPEYSEMALSLALTIYLEYDQWQAVLDVSNRVALWELKPESQSQLDYALALSYENLGQSTKAVPVWQKLYASNRLPSSQMAYVAFFLARNAERERELEQAYALGRDALNRLLEEARRNPDQADTGKITSQLASLMDVAETVGHLREALGFGEQYLGHLPPDDPERTSARYRMARIYKKQGDVDRWKAILTEIAREYPDSVYGQIAASELKAASLVEDAARYSPTGRI